MNSTQRRQARQKRLKHEGKQHMKSYVKMSCARRGIDYAGFELRDDGQTIVVFDMAGDEHVSTLKGVDS